MNNPERFSAEWLANNCDPSFPFERAVQKELRRLIEVEKQHNKLRDQHPELTAALAHATERALVHKERADKMQAQLDAANKACNELAAHVDDLLKQRDHWHSRLLAEVGKRNKTGATA